MVARWLVRLRSMPYGPVAPVVMTDDDDTIEDELVDATAATDESTTSPLPSPCPFDAWRAKMSFRRVGSDDRGRPVLQTAVGSDDDAAGDGDGTCVGSVG